MNRKIGTKSIGIRCPIIKKGDDLVNMTIESVLLACEEEKTSLRNKDVICLTESIVARAQGNYATVDQIAEDVKNKFGNQTIGVIFPILSRNRFSLILKGIARGCQKMILILNYPHDEMGNFLLDYDQLDEKNVNMYTDDFDYKSFTNQFVLKSHEFTRMNYVDYYRKIVSDENCQLEIIFSNQVKTILKYTDFVLNCDVFSRERTKKILLKNGAKKVLGLDDILTSSVNGSGYNEKFGLLGSNKSTEEIIKLFPKEKESKDLVEEIQRQMKNKTGKDIEVMIFGDGAWEQADPVVSPAFTKGLIGTPNEVKIKYLADNAFSGLHGDELKDAVLESIKRKEKDLKGKMISEGTTPRENNIIIGSLCDLTCGSGDKGTPIVLVQGFFDDYSTQY